MKGELIRFAYLQDATLGWLTFGDLRLATVEDAWHLDPDGPGGQRRDVGLPESCVPDGLYELEPHNGQRWQDVRALVNPRLGVWHWPGGIPSGQPWGRFACLIHSGNSALSVEGCIAVGHRHGILDGKPWVFESAQALDQLRQTIGPTSPHQLLIRPTTGTAEAS